MGAGPAPDAVPLSEVIGALSYALDLTEGEPPGHALRSCAIGMRLAREIGLGEDEQADLFYALLLKDAGCSANAARMAALFAADERVAKRTSKRINWSRPTVGVRVVDPYGGAGRDAARPRPPAAPAPRRGPGHPLADARPLRARGRGRPPARARPGHRGRDPRARRALGRRRPARGHARRGDPAARADPVPRADGRDLPRRARRSTARCASRAGAAAAGSTPSSSTALHRTRRDRAFWAGSCQPSPPPERQLPADDAYLDRIASAFSGVVDAKSPWTYRHSDRTCVIAMSVAVLLDCDEQTLDDMRRAAMLHDIGKLAISNRILDKPARLSDAEFDLVRQHPLFTEWILERTPGLAHARAAGGRPPRAARRRWLPARAHGPRAHAADADPGRRRRL